MIESPASGRRVTGGLRTAIELLLLGLPLLSAWVAFADLEGYPSNDDPFYARPVRTLAVESEFVIVRQYGELTASSLLHILLGGAYCSLAGFSYRNLFLVVIVQLWVTAGAIYAAARMLNCQRAVAVLLGLAYLCSPMIFGRGFRFMTDAPATAWGAMAVLCYLQAFRTERLVWLVFGSLLASGAFWIRQTHAAVAVFPLLTLAVLARRKTLTISPWPGFTAIVLPLAISVAVFESGLLTHNDIARIDDAPPQAFGLGRIEEIMVATYGLLLSIGFITLPLAPLGLAAAWRTWRSMSPGHQRWSAGLALACLLLFATPFIATSGRACLTNSTGQFVQNAHYGPVFLSDSYEAGRWDDLNGVRWSMIVWQILTVASVLSLTVWAWWGISGCFHRDSPGADGWPAGRFDLGMGLLAVIPVIAIGLFAALSGILGRYWMMVHPVIFIWIAVIAGPSIRLDRRFMTAVSAVFLISMTAMSVVFSHDLLAWNQARWEQVERWVAEGLRPQDFDGGRDVNAWFRAAEDPETFARDGDDSTWWSGLATRAISADPRKGWKEVDRITWSAWATGGEHHILVLEKDQSLATQ